MGDIKITDAFDAYCARMIADSYCATYKTIGDGIRAAARKGYYVYHTPVPDEWNGERILEVVGFFEKKGFKVLKVVDSSNIVTKLQFTWLYENASNNECH